MFTLSFGVRDALYAFIHFRLRAPDAKPDRPDPFVEHDPRKVLGERARSSTPGHLLGAGGRAEVFRIPE